MTTSTKVNTETAIRELYKAYNKLNERFYNNELPEVMIVIFETAKQNAYGWFTPSKVWKDVDGTTEMHEIAMSAEYMNRDWIQVMQTLHHEMIHLYCHINNIKDTSRNGRYHNGKFKEQCEKHGFEYKITSPDKSIGWSRAELTEETQRIIAEEFELNPEAFKLARAIAPKRERRKNRSKYECLNCEYSLRGKSGLNINCGDCEEALHETTGV